MIWLELDLFLRVPHGSSTTCFQSACCCRAELNSYFFKCILSNFAVFKLDGWFVLSFELGATELGSTFETAAVPSSCHCRCKLIWVWHSKSTMYGISLISKRKKERIKVRGRELYINIHQKIARSKLAYYILQSLIFLPPTILLWIREQGYSRILSDTRLETWVLFINCHSH